MKKQEIARQLALTIYHCEKLILEGKLVDWGSVLRAFIKYELKEPKEVIDPKKEEVG